MEIPASVKEIGVDTFYGCSSLKSVVFAEDSKLEKIGEGSFYQSGIEKIAIPRGVEEIPRSAFEECEALEEVTLDEGSRLKAMQNNAFNGCMNLKSIRFPDGLERIGVECFCGSSLEEVILPESVKEVGAWAF